MERKVFMGVAQLLLDELDLVNTVIGWYKLFTSASLVSGSQTTASGGTAAGSMTPAVTNASVNLLAAGTQSLHHNSGSSLESAAFSVT